MGFNKLFAGVILTSLFVFAVMSFNISLAKDNDAETSLLDIPILNKSFGNLNGNMSLQGKAENQRNIYEEEDIQVSLGDLVFFGAISTLRTFSSSLTTIINVILLPIVILLSLPPIILGTISTLILAGVVFKSWKFSKTGS